MDREAVEGRSSGTPRVDEALIGWLGSRPMKSFTCRAVLLLTLFLLPGAPAFAVPPGWGVGASVSTPRDWHSATLLRDGSVLIAGGYAHGTGATNRAERYFPAANAWVPVGNMVYERRQHAAALLADGRVLVVGGRNPLGVQLRTAEIYDPGTNAWLAVGDMGAPRSDPTATVLPDGKVLVAGGFPTGGTPTNSAELFDPTTNAFTPVPGMGTARGGHTAVPIAGGNVLVVGGQVNDTSPGGQVELYDWSRRQWTGRTGMSTARVWHRANLLNDGRVLVSGGYNGAGFSNTADVYNPTTNAWTATAPMAGARGYHGASTLHNGRVLVTGGDNASGLADQTSELYNPATNAWTATGNMTLARHAQGSTLLFDGRVLISSGWSHALAYAAPSELWTPTTNLLSDAAVSFDDAVPGTVGGGVAHITNTGDSPLLASGFALGGSFPGDYAVTSDGCTGVAVPPGGTCAIGLQFAPGATGARGATLTFAANTQTVTHGVSLIGRGVPAPVVPAAPLQRIVVTLAYRYSGVNSKATKLIGLTVKGVPQGSTVTVTCRKGCATKKVVKRNARGNVKVSAIHKSKRLKVGTKITVQVTKPGMVAATKTLTIRKKKPPLVR
jgi:N-acetylneuraminic acid mutarotase